MANEAHIKLMMGQDIPPRISLSTAASMKLGSNWQIVLEVKEKERMSLSQLRIDWPPENQPPNQNNEGRR